MFRFQLRDDESLRFRDSSVDQRPGPSKASIASNLSHGIHKRGFPARNSATFSKYSKVLIPLGLVIGLSPCLFPRLLQRRTDMLRNPNGHETPPAHSRPVLFLCACFLHPHGHALPCDVAGTRQCGDTTIDLRAMWRALRFGSRWANRDCRGFVDEQRTGERHRVGVQVKDQRVQDL